MTTKDLLIGIDAGTSVIKSIAFDTSGEQIAVASVRNRHESGPNGAVTQNMDITWADCVQSLQGLVKKVPDLAERTLGISVTGQGDGTWLVDSSNRPVGDAWLWLDARSAATVNELNSLPSAQERFYYTGTGLNTCQQGSQLAYMLSHRPDLIKAADCALHCKDWLYLNLTNVRATDPSEASFSFGDFRTREYNDTVIDSLGLSSQRHLLPEIIDGTKTTHPLSKEAAKLTGLLAGTPVSLGYVDMVMTALGAGVHTDSTGAACSVVGSTGVHMRSVTVENVYLNHERTGYVIALPIENRVTQVQTNMSATLNLDWLLTLAADIVSSLGHETSMKDLMPMINNWLSQTQPGQLLYHPYISQAGERGPFINANARASFIGLSYQHRFPDLVRSVVEGLGMAMRDCYQSMGELPTEVRITGGAARSDQLRATLAASLGASVRISSREEAGAAGVAMMAAVANGVYPNMDACIDEWVSPLLSELEPADNELTNIYDQLYAQYRDFRLLLPDIWSGIATMKSR